MKNSAIIPAFLLLILTGQALIAGESGFSARVYDLNGRLLGAIAPDRPTSSAGLFALNPTPMLAGSGERKVLAAGIYLVVPSAAPPEISAGGIFGFVDVTDTYLPAEQWDAGQIHAADLNGDGRDDIVVTRATVTCDSNDADYRPRVWIQTEQGNFVDETDARIPPIYAPCYNFLVFDADGDGAPDIFLTGHYCQSTRLTAALLINDGDGVFTDESDARLPSFAAEGAISFAYAAAAGRLTGSGVPDLVVTVFGSSLDTANHLPIVPEIWLNDGHGRFMRDTAGRFPRGGNYGYMVPFITDIDGDTLQDVLFADAEFLRIITSGLVIDSLSGKTSCYRNTGDGFLVDETEARIPTPDAHNVRTLALADVDGQGGPDILEVGFPFKPYQHQVRMMMNDGTGHFSATAGSLPDSLSGWFNQAVFGNLSGDGDPDLFMIRVEPGQPDYDVLLLNQGGGTFGDASLLLPQNLDFSVGCDLMDYDRDGAADILISNSGDSLGGVGRNRLYHNTLDQSGWVHQVSGTSVRLNGVAMLDSLTAFVVGDSGTILKTTNGGEQWYAQQSGVTVPLNAVAFRDAQLGYVAGMDILLKTTDGGDSWAQLVVSGNFVTLGISPWWAGPSVFIGSDSGKLRRSMDGTDSLWKEHQFAVGRILAFRFAHGALNTYSVQFASERYTYFSPVEDLAWDSVQNPIIKPWDALYGGDLAHDTQFLVGFGGDPGAFPIVLRRAATDTTWDRKNLPALGTTRLSSVAPFNTSQTVYLCGSGGRLFRSTDEGDTWVEQLTGTTYDLNASSFLNEQDGLVVGDHGTVLWLKGGTVMSVPPPSRSLLPSRSSLVQNYPNPFNPSTVIRYMLAHSARVNITIYDVLGRHIKVLVDEQQSAGERSVRFDGASLPSGVYFCRFQMDDPSHIPVRFVDVKKMILAK